VSAEHNKADHLLARRAQVDAGLVPAPSGPSLELRSRVVAALAAALAEDIRQWPDGPPAEGSVPSGTACDRRRPERVVFGRLHD
jgi:hypothetical protein